MRRAAGRGPGTGVGSTRRSCRRCIEPARPDPCCRFVPPSRCNPRGDGRAAPSSSGRPSRGVKTLAAVFCYTKSGSAAVSNWNAHTDEKPKYKGNSMKKSTANSYPTRRLQRGPDKNPDDVIALSPQTQKNVDRRSPSKKGSLRRAHCSSAAHHPRALPRSTSHLRHKYGEASRHVLRRLRSASRPLSPERVGRRES